MNFTDRIICQLFEKIDFFASECFKTCDATLQPVFFYLFFLNVKFFSWNLENQCFCFVFFLLARRRRKILTFLVVLHQFRSFSEGNFNIFTKSFHIWTILNVKFLEFQDLKCAIFQKISHLNVKKKNPGSARIFAQFQNSLI